MSYEASTAAVDCGWAGWYGDQLVELVPAISRHAECSLVLVEEHQLQPSGGHFQ